MFYILEINALDLSTVKMWAAELRVRMVSLECKFMFGNPKTAATEEYVDCFHHMDDRCQTINYKCNGLCHSHIPSHNWEHCIQWNWYDESFDFVIWHPIYTFEPETEIPFMKWENTHSPSPTNLKAVAFIRNSLD